MWRITVPEAPVEMKSALGPPLKLAFSPTSKYLAGIPGFFPARARIWRFKENDLIAEAAELLTRNLCPEEWQRYAIGEYQKTFDHLPVDQCGVVLQK